MFICSEGNTPITIRESIGNGITTIVCRRCVHRGIRKLLCYCASALWRYYVSPTGSETVAQHQKDSIGTRETQCISRSFGIYDDKPINGKELQMMHWESDQLIVVMKQGNACGAKRLTGKP